MKFLILSFTVAIFLSLAAVAAQEPPSPNAVGIGQHLVVMPVGRILLIEREDFIGAIKFSKNGRKKEGIYSKYEFFNYQKGSFAKMEERVIWLKEPSRGFWAKLKGFLSFHDDPFRYADKIEFKTFELFAHPADEGHSTVYFWNQPNRVDPKLRMAPTPWTQVEEVRLSNPMIRWFSYEEKRKWEVIPIDKIWG